MKILLNQVGLRFDFENVNACFAKQSASRVPLVRPGPRTDAAALDLDLTAQYGSALSKDMLASRLDSGDARTQRRRNYWFDSGSKLALSTARIGARTLWRASGFQGEPPGVLSDECEAPTAKIEGGSRARRNFFRRERSRARRNFSARTTTRVVARLERLKGRSRRRL